MKNLHTVLVLIFLTNYMLAQDPCDKPPYAEIDAIGTPFACDNFKVQLDAETFSTGVGPLSYEWSDGVYVGSPGQGYVFVPDIYSVTITDANGCTATASVNVFDWMSPPTAIAIIDASTNHLNCYTDYAVLDASPSQGEGVISYYWSDGLGTSPSVTVNSGGIYSVTVTDSNGCTDEVSVKISKDFIPPIVKILEESTPCSNTTTLTANANPNNNVTYNWNTNSQQSTITVTSSGTYTVTVTDNTNGCSSESSIAVEIAPPLEADFIVKDLCEGFIHSLGSILVVPTGGAAPYSYQWSNGATGNNISYVEGGTYTVTVTDNNDCTLVLTTEYVSICCPDIPEITKIENVKECIGSSVTIGPEYVYGNEVDLTWTYNSQPYPEYSQYITFDPFLQSHEGKYVLTVYSPENCTTIHYVYYVYPTCCEHPQASTFHNVCYDGFATLGPGSNGFPTGTEFEWIFNSTSVGNTTPLTLGPINSTQAGLYTMTATLEDCPLFSITYNLNVLNCRMASNEILDVRIFPNPVSDILYLDLALEEDIPYSIWDMSGRQVLNGIFEKYGHHGIVTGKLKQGIYIISFIHDGIPYQSRFVKK